MPRQWRDTFKTWKLACWVVNPIFVLKVSKDGLAKSRQYPQNVIPANAGIQELQ
jgi:hypothetical protein